MQIFETAIGVIAAMLTSLVVRPAGEEGSRRPID